MLNRRVFRLSFLFVTAVVVGAWALQDAPPKGERDAKRYKVTPWPADSAERNFHEHVEQHLNEMAAQGWEFHSVLVGQPTRVMVFRRPG